MSKKVDSHMYEELKENLKAKKPDQPAEKILAVFCRKTGLSMNECTVYYNHLVKDGAIKEK